MRDGHRISVIIPALNEAKSIGNVLDDIPDWVDEVIVADNGSTDDTPAIAESRGARVVHAFRRGYGSACLAGIAALNHPDVVVFLDGDYSDYPNQMPRLVDPVIANEADLIIGSRALGNAEPGALTPQARFGNRLACFLMRLFWGTRFTDLGPFRAIRYKSLKKLRMADPDYGWTVEMQIKAILHNLRAAEVPVDYRKRIGRSKVSGTVRGVVGAGYKILGTIAVSAAQHHLFRGKPAANTRLIIFTRYPTPGETKTRLIPALGPEGAADLQRAMTHHAVHTAKEASAIDPQVWYTGADEDAMRDWLGDLDFQEQPEGDLGLRMKTALSQAFADGHKRALVIGIDCPSVTSAILEHAAEALRHVDIVVGPATDGGYYLIGACADAFSEASDLMFTNIAWGTESVYADTVTRLDTRNIPWHRLCHLNDIDEADDLPEWDALQPDADTPRISIIIPVLNGADTVAQTLDSITEDASLQVIVVDGGSTDDTVTLAKQSGAQVIPSARGRAAQMNRGAAHAHGEYLLFLHADTKLPKNFVAEIDEILSNPGNALGAFRFATTDTSPTMRIIAAVANFRARWLKLPYGDQALFVRRDRFRQADGYADLPIMEDFDLVRRIAKHGRIRIAQSAAITCARRWERIGPFRAVVKNQCIVFGWYFGVAPERLAAWYRGTPRP